MESPEDVNEQLDDSVSQTNAKVIGDAPAEALGDQAQSKTTLSEAEFAEAEANGDEQESENPGAGKVEEIYALDTVSTGDASKQILDS